MRSSLLRLLPMWVFLVILGACSSSPSAEPEPKSTTTTAVRGPLVEGTPEEIDAVGGQGAAAVAAALERARDEPRQASGASIVVAVVSDDAAHPGFLRGVDAALELVNEELGGVGEAPGRPIEVVRCDAGEGPVATVLCVDAIARATVALQGVNPFTDQTRPLLVEKGVPIVAAVGAHHQEWSAEGLWVTAPGGGCVGVLTAMSRLAVDELGATKLGLPWIDTDTGRVCHNDAQRKTLVSFPRLGETAFVAPMLGVRNDVGRVVSELREFAPDAVVFDGPSDLCWDLVDELLAARLMPPRTDVVLSTACLDDEALAAAGEEVEGIHFVGPVPGGRPELHSGLQAVEFDVMRERLDGADGFAARGFAGMLTIWELLEEAASSAIEPAVVADLLSSSSGRHAWASSPVSCADAVEGYESLCNGSVSVWRWSGERLELERDELSGLELVESTPFAGTAPPPLPDADLDES